MNRDQTLHLIAHKLKNLTSDIHSPGLFHGHMGIALFFFHYARYSSSESFENIAMEHIEKMQTALNMNSPVDYVEGLSGIGCAIEYLIQNDYIEADSSEILCDFDHRLSHYVRYITPDSFCLSDGLSGIGRYFLYRLNSQNNEFPELQHLYNQETLIHVVNIIENSDLMTRMENSTQVPDTISFLCDAHTYGVCNRKIERCLSKILLGMRQEEVPKKLHPNWFLANSKLSNLPKFSAFESKAELLLSTSLNEASINLTNKNVFEIDDLLWMLKYKNMAQSYEIYRPYLKTASQLLDNAFEKYNVLQEASKQGANLLNDYNGDYARIGLSLIARDDPENTNWLNLFI